GQSEVSRTGGPALAAGLAPVRDRARRLLRPDDRGGVLAAVAACAALGRPGNHHRRAARRCRHRALLAADRTLRLSRQHHVRRAQRTDPERGTAMKRRIVITATSALLALASAAALAAPAAEAAQPLNVTAIAMFIVFVLATLGITYWAARQTKTANDFFAAGGGISGFRNGLAIAGDYMSAATLLGACALVYGRGYDGLLYVAGFFVGWPILLFLMAERLRNLGKFTFADVISERLDRTKMRCLAAIGALTVVFFYLIVQMVGAGELVHLLFNIDYAYAVIAVGVLMMVYVTFGGMIATTWVQIVKAVLLLFGGTVLGILAFAQFGFSFEDLAAKAVAAHKSGAKIMGPGTLLAAPISTLSLSLGAVFGLAGLPHILMRFFTVPNAKEARKSVFYASGFIGYFFLLTFILGLAAVVIVGTDPQFFQGGRVGGTLIGGGNMVALHLAKAIG